LLGAVVSFPCAAGDDTPERNRKPYGNVDWEHSIQINTTSHVHCENDRTLAVLKEHNFGFFTLSNYHPAAPTYPAAKMKAGRRGLPVTDYPLMVNGRLREGPFDWNEIISGWKEKLSDEQKAQLPFKESAEPMFKSWDEGTLEAPNAEHYSFYFGEWHYAEMHLCCPGSSYSSGTFDVRDAFGTVKYGGYGGGCHLHWKAAIDEMIKHLIIPEGGGVTINHPAWSNLDRNLMLNVLDHDPRVLGIEVLNSGQSSEIYWDWVLSTGRQCFGFFVPDHGAQETVPFEKFGVNVLIVPQATVEACLIAYRKGNFYGAERGHGELRFTSISFDDNVLRASTDKPARFEVISAKGVIYSTSGTELDFIPETWDLGFIGPQADVFLRIKAYATDGSGEVLYSQPFMLSRPYQFRSSYPY